MESTPRRPRQRDASPRSNRHARARGALSMLSLTGRVLQSVVRLCCTRPVLTVVTGCLLAVLGFGYAAHSLTLEASQFNLLPSHQRYVTLYKEYSQDFGQLEDIVVVVQSP